MSGEPTEDAKADAPLDAERPFAGLVEKFEASVILARAIFDNSGGREWYAELQKAEQRLASDKAALLASHAALEKRVRDLEAALVNLGEMAGEAVSWMPKIVRQDTLAQEIADLLERAALRGAGEGNRG